MVDIFGGKGKSFRILERKGQPLEKRSASQGPMVTCGSTFNHVSHHVLVGVCPIKCWTTVLNTLPFGQVLKHMKLGTHFPKLLPCCKNICRKPRVDDTDPQSDCSNVSTCIVAEEHVWATDELIELHQQLCQGSLHRPEVSLCKGPSKRGHMSGGFAFGF